MRTAIVSIALALVSTPVRAQEAAWTDSTGRISLEFASAGWVEVSDRPAEATDMLLGIVPSAEEAAGSMSRACYLTRTFVALPNAKQDRANDIMRKPPPGVQAVEANGIVFHRLVEKTTDPYDPLPGHRYQDIYFVATEGGFDQVVFACLVLGPASGHDAVATEMRAFMDTLQLRPAQ